MVRRPLYCGRSAGVVASEMLRLNTAIPPVPYAQQNRLGIVGNILAGGTDNAGFPNGRRPKDDVVDIALVAVMGGLCMANGTGNAVVKAGGVIVQETRDYDGIAGKLTGITGIHHHLDFSSNCSKVAGSSRWRSMTLNSSTVSGR